MQNESEISSPTVTKSNSKRKWLIIGAVMLVAIIVAIIVIVALGNKPKKAAIEQTPQLSSLTGINLLKETSKATAVAYQNVPVIQACNIFTLKDIKNAKLDLHPNPAADVFVYQRMYFNNEGSAPVNTGDRENINKCRYGLENGEIIELNVYQPIYVDNLSMRSEIERFSPSTEIEGLKTYKKAAGPSDSVFKTVTEEYLFQTGDNFVRAMITHKPDSTLGKDLAAVLTTLGRNIKQQAAHPTGPSTISYSTAAFSKSYANACIVSKPDDFTAVFDTAPMPHITEGFATKVGTVYFNDDPDKIRYPNIQHQCVRAVTVEVPMGELMIPKDRELTIETTTYLTDEASKKEMAFHKKVVQTKDTSRNVGDEAYIIVAAGRSGISFGKPGTVVFRHGRVVVSVSLADPLDTKTEKSNLDQTSKLEKAAAQIAARMSEF